MLHFKGRATFKCKDCGHKFEAFDTEGGIRCGPNLPQCPKCGSKETRKTIFFPLYLCLIICCFPPLLFPSCNSNKGPQSEELTPLLAMDYFLQLSPVEGAKYYKEQRIHHLFFDELYGDSIIPAFQYCNYYELKDICKWLKDTPYCDIAFQLLNDKKEEYSKYINDEIEEQIKNEQDVFKKCIFPAIELEIDSMLEKDIEKTMSKYAGGFLNYKKLTFLFGRGRNDFKQMFWNEFDLEKYRNHISKHIQAYLDTISKRHNEYCNNIVGCLFEEKIMMDSPELKIGLSKSTLTHIQDYTKKQTNEIWVDIIKDWVTPAILAGTTGGLSTLYDIGTFAYDVKVTFDDIKNEKIDPDDMVKYVCNHDLSYQIDNYYLNHCLEKVNLLIKESNHKLYNRIITLL